MTDEQWITHLHTGVDGMTDAERIERIQSMRAQAEKHRRYAASDGNSDEATYFKGKRVMADAIIAMLLADMAVKKEND